MQKTSYYIINGITLYRVVASVFLLYLVIAGNTDWFKWLLAVSFFTDAIDGFLARKYKVVSKWGSRIDSVGDDLTVLVAIIGLLVLKQEFIRQQIVWIVVLLAIFLFQLIAGLLRYGKMTSFHTYAAKVAAVLQGCFLILSFFLQSPPLWLFYAAIIITAIDLIEEIILVFMLPKWETDVKGLYWVMRRRKK